jgi:hypothetical protein
MKPNLYTLILLSTLSLNACVHSDMTQPAKSAKSNGIEVGKFFAQVDKNHDGCITDAEWFGKKLPAPPHDNLSKNGCITLEAMAQAPLPEHMDSNNDLILTLDEFLDYAKNNAPKPTDAPPPKSN